MLMCTKCGACFATTKDMDAHNCVVDRANWLATPPQERISTAPGSINGFEAKSDVVFEPDGAHALWCWFGLSYATWLTLPRVLMHEMPDAWQGQMAKLLQEFNDAFPNAPAATTRVIPTEGNRLVKTPGWLLNYRHPDAASIAACRSHNRAEERYDGKSTDEKGGREEGSEAGVPHGGRGDGLGGQDAGGHQGGQPPGR